MFTVSALLFPALLTACAATGDGDKKAVGPTPTPAPVTLKVGADSYPDTDAINAVASVMLEGLGYKVELVTLDVGVMYQAIVDGQIDVYSGGYLPNTHSNYWAKYGEQLEKLGPLNSEVRHGLAVPNYMTEYNSITDLKGKEDVFGGVIISSQAGSGITRQAGEIVDAYGLDLKVQPTSDAAQSAAVKAAIAAKKPILFAKGSPNWWFNEWPLKFLDDPKKVTGDEDSIFHIAAKTGLKSKAPEAYNFYSRFVMTGAQENAVMNAIRKGGDPKVEGKKFIDAHPDLVKQWLNGPAK